jgi:hypothetical protein
MVIVRCLGWFIASCLIDSTRHSCGSCFLVFPLVESISVSHNPPSDYPEAYRAGSKHAKGEKQLALS